MSVDSDAREFGRYLKQGGWRLGLLVARSVEPGKGQGKPRPNLDEAEKVSAQVFADKAGIRSKQTVAYYYKAWELAADDGHCQHPQDLSPGDEDLADFEEDDEHTRELWSKYLQKARQPKKPPRESGANSSAPAPGNRTLKEAQLIRVIEQVSTDTGRLSERLGKLGKLVPNVSFRAKEDSAGLVEGLRVTRQQLEEQCKFIDEVLEYIGYGDEENGPNE